MRALFVMLCFSVCTACQKDTEPSIPYFQFDEVGRHLLSGLRPNDSIHFKGSNGSERHFRIFEMETKKN